MEQGYPMHHYVYNRRLPQLALIIVAPLALLWSMSPSADDHSSLTAEPEPEARVVQSWFNPFGIAVLEGLLEAGSDDNIVISPLSLATALTMTAQGAAGETAASFAEVLGYAVEHETVAADQLGHLNAELTRDAGELILRQANGLWIATDMELHADFAQAQHERFAAQIEAVDFSLATTLEAINDWFAEQTAGLIPQLLDSLAAETRIVLGNALYMKGYWQTPFDPDLTESAPFYRADGTESTVDLMQRQDSSLLYRETEQAYAVRLPFADPEFELSLVLPKPDLDITTLMASVGTAGLLELLAEDGFHPRPGRVAVPRLDLALGGDMTSVLRDLGLFATQDFSRLAQEPLVFDQIVHKTAFKLDETGAEAAAATAVIGVRSALPVEPFDLVFNRPFLLSLRHVPSQALLFVGQVGAP